jgi:Tfp pilus assembly protein PilF
MTGLLIIATVRQVGVWHDSVSLFRHMISQLNPKDVYRVDLQRRLGVYYLTLAKPELELAQQEFESALRTAPLDERVRTLLAEVFLDQRRFDRAEMLIRDGLVANPSSVGLRTRLGQVLVQLHRNNEAIVQFNQVLQADPNNAAAREGLRSARATP